MLEILPRNGYKTQANAIAYHNERKERMLSLPDVFQLDQQSLVELRKDWGGFRWTVTSTRVYFNNNTVVHNADSSVIKPTKKKLSEIPVCQPIYLGDLLNMATGLEYVRALINDKKATKAQIISRFEYISDRKAENIRFWTPTLSERNDKPIRAVRLYVDDDVFVVVAYGWLGDDCGLSRGVRVSSAKQNEPEA